MVVVCCGDCGCGGGWLIGCSCDYSCGGGGCSGCGGGGS